MDPETRDRVWYLAPFLSVGKQGNHYISSCINCRIMIKFCTRKARVQPKNISKWQTEWVHIRCLTDQQVWFTVDFQETFSQKFSRICSFIDIYRGGSLTPRITLILFTQATAQLKDIYRGLIAPISINPGLLQHVFYWYTVKYKNFESARKFPGDFANFQ